MPETELASTCPDVVVTTVRRFAALVRCLAFWSAVVLPVLYLPPLLAGPATKTELAVLAALIGVHVTAILVGHDYRGIAGDAGSRPG